MYGKIFESIYDGSLYGEFEAIVVFKAMIVLADENGQLDMSPQSMAGRTSYPLEIVKKGLSVLQKPDPDSRQPGHEGRRIIPLENGRAFGWQIVNYQYYRNLASREAKKEADRVRIAEKRSKDKASSNVAGCRNVSQNVADVAHTDTDTYTDNKNTCANSFARFWSIYPKKKSKGQAEKAWKKINPDEQLVELIGSKIEQAKTSDDWLKDNGRFIPYPATWLNAKGWEDELGGKHETGSTAFERWNAKLTAGLLD